MNHRVIIKKLYAEDIFNMFHNLIIRDGGDGAGAIICGNPREACELFVEHVKKEIWDKFPGSLILDEHEESGFQYLNWHDNNENFIFTNDPGYDLRFGDITWVIENDCLPGFIGDKDPQHKVWLKGITQ